MEKEIKKKKKRPVKAKKPLKERGNHKKLTKAQLVLVIGLVIILIPCIIFGVILLKAAVQSGSPVEGSRFKNDLDPAITSSDTSSLTSEIKAMSDVEDCEIVLKSAQYRINVDTVDSLDSEDIEELAVEIYDKVNSKLPVSTYFTSTSTEKMYDLAINVYNVVDSDNDSMVYYILTKNSKMDDYSLQCVSEPVDEDLAAELRGETDDSDVGVGDASAGLTEEELEQAEEE